MVSGRIRVSSALSYKVGFRQFRMPVWLLSLAVMGIAAVAGQTIGEVPGAGDGSGGDSSELSSPPEPPADVGNKIALAGPVVPVEPGLKADSSMTRR